MLQEPLVSVIIPVYNVEEYLKECIDSVLYQTYNNIEIIAVNDGSTDNSSNILNQYSQRFENIIVIEQINSGQSVARNKGIMKSKGKYLYFLDADDYILPDTINNLIDVMERNNLDLVRFGAEAFYDGISLKKDKKQYDLKKYFEEKKLYNKTEFLSSNLNSFRSSPCLYIIKRDLLLNNNILFRNNIIHEDELFTLEVFLNTSSFMYDSNLYYRRRYRADSTMTSVSKKSLRYSFDSYCSIINELKNMLQKYNNPLEIKLIQNRIHSIYINLIKIKDIERSYKLKKILKIKGLSLEKKIYYYLNFNLKRNLKKILRRN